MTTTHLISAGFQHAAEAVQAAAEVGVPLYIVAAMLEKESKGANVYGNDRGGVFSKDDPTRPPGGAVTEENYRIFEQRVFAGETSNGVGPAQITYPGFIKDAHARGIFLWKPLDNIKYGVSLLKEYLNGSETDDAIRYAGRRYNGAAAYGEDLLLRARQWQTRLSEEAPMAKNHPVSAVATLETELRRRGYQIACGPTHYKNGTCPSHGGTWPHLKNSTHTIGGAIDVNKDLPGTAISTFEKAHLDDLARELMSRGWRVIWGVANHFDHLHVDFNLYGAGGGHQVVFQGPNAGFTVAHILDVQTKLKKLGIYKGALDGLRETNTINAIKAFQKKAGLSQDGKPGEKTMTALNKAVATPAPAPKPKKTLDQRVAPYRLSGSDAFATAVALRRFKPPTGKGVILAGRDGADHIQAGIIAGRHANVEVLPTRVGGSLPASIANDIKAIKPAWIRVAGGATVVPSTAVEAAFKAAGLTLPS